MKTRRFKLKRGDMLDIDEATGRKSDDGLRSVVLARDDCEVVHVDLTDRELDKWAKSGKEFPDSMLVIPTCDDCGKEIDGEVHQGKLNVEDDTKPFIPQWCDDCYNKRRNT